MAANDLYGWFPTMSQPLTAPAQNRWTIPEQAPGALTGDVTRSGLLDFGMGPLSQLAYQMAGSPKRPPFADVRMPFTGDPSEGMDVADPASAAGVLSSALAAKKLNDLYGVKPSASAAVTPSIPSGNGGISSYTTIPSIGQTPSSVGGYKFTPGYDFLGGPAAIPSGLQALDYSSAINKMSDAELANYLGSDPAILGKTSLANASKNIGGGLLGAYNLYQGIDQKNPSSIATGAGQLAGAISAAAPSSALGSALAGSGAASALGLAGIGFAVTDYLNKGPLNDNKSKDRNIAAYTQATGARMIELPMGRIAAFYYAMPDGTLISNKDFNDLAGSWYGMTYAPDGNPAEWQAKYEDFSRNLKPATLPKGYSWDGTKIVKNF